MVQRIFHEVSVTLWKKINSSNLNFRIIKGEPNFQILNQWN